MTTTFAALGLSDPILRSLVELGYEEPTPVQAQAITLLLAGSDLIAQAQTGTGKTAAFALPIIERLAEGAKAGRAPQALVMTPTRELAMQVAEAFHTYGRHRGVVALPVYGGQPIERQLGALKRGVDVVVGTPGRLLDHMRRGTLDLTALRTVILDEADEMFAMGFVEDIGSILDATPAERQTALFSATMPGPVARLASAYLREPARVTVGTSGMSVPQIRQIYYEVGGRDKFEALARVLDFERPTSAIVFCRTKLEVDSLGDRLVGRAYPAETLHGDLSQVQRDRVMQRFRAGQAEILVATDVAARGLDVEQVSHVINYDLPHDPENYVHRIGRTGRAGRLGCAVTLVTPRERRAMQSIARVTGADIQRQVMPTVADVLARRQEQFKQTLRETMAGGGLEPFIIMAESLGEDYSPTELAAAAFKLLLGEQKPESSVDLARDGDGPGRRDRPDRDEERAARGERWGAGGKGGAGRGDRPGRDRDRGAGGPADRGAGDRGPGPKRAGFQTAPGLQRLFIDMGREDGLRPADLVGAIAGEANIPGASIGAIDMYDRFCFVEVPQASAEQVLKALSSAMVRGRKVKATVARPMVRRG
ncbi:MAG: DEAD/DEAH box helicase [Anaerolineae bacterium]|jgi:ATP-dependent RNA helicase DeaD